MAIQISLLTKLSRLKYNVACCSILVSSKRMGWSSVQACSAMADLSVQHLMHASLCSFRRVVSRRVVSPMYTFPQVCQCVWMLYRANSHKNDKFNCVMLEEPVCLYNQMTDNGMVLKCISIIYRCTKCI